MNSETTLETTRVRRVFFLLAVFVMIATLGGILALTAMEYQARAALPSNEQTAEAIASIYDGAVCLSCDYGRFFLVMFGPLSLIAVLSGWAIYEVGRRVSTPK